MEKKDLATLNDSKYTEQLKLSFIADGSIKWYHHFEKLPIFNKVKAEIPLWGIYQEEWRCVPTKKNLYKMFLEALSESNVH